MLKLIVSLLISSFSVFALAQDFQNGDLIFQKSQSRQAPAIREATGSDWTHMGILFQDRRGRWMVYEAISTVKSTPLNSFIRRSRGHHVVVKRVKENLLDMSNSRIQRALYEELEKDLGKTYDIWFEWSDERIYCSELIFKGFDRAFNLRIGEIEQYRDMNLDGPHVQRLIDERYRRTGRPLDLDEFIVTPVSMFDSENLELVYDSDSK